MLISRTAPPDMVLQPNLAGETRLLMGVAAQVQVAESQRMHGTPRLPRGLEFLGRKLHLLKAR